MLLALSIPLLVLVRVSAAAKSCTSKTFKAAQPELFGVEILDVVAGEVKGHTWDPMTGALPPLPVMPEAIDFCNVTVFYTHPGLNDTVRVSIWLPKEDAWNQRFMGLGGGGYAAGWEDSQAASVQMGFAAANTDAGHTNIGHPVSTILTADTWALTSPGNVNLHLLQNFGYRSLEELAPIGKHVTQTYYGKDISYSYWNGCSTGGRQGLVLAQRYPDHFQGILAAAPASNWVTFLITEYYAHVKMQELNYFPAACELNAISQAALEACDELDGVKDGVIGAPTLCKFDPFSVVGQKYDCEGDSRKITKQAAEIALATWTGPVKDGNPIWFGLTHETSITGVDEVFSGLASTICDKNNKNCKSKPFLISSNWIKNFVLKDPDFDLTTIDEEKFYEILRTTRQEYHSIMDSADPDLSTFKASGNKMITWHGLADQLIPPGGSQDYYRRVEALFPEVRDFYRLYEVPGVQHCFGGPGAFPATAIHQLMNWVENGSAPEFLDGVTMPTMEVGRKICAWPKVAVLVGGDNTKAESFECRDGFDGVKGEKGHDEL